MIKTVNNLPDGLSGPLTLHVNDENQPITARNIVLLLLFLYTEDPNEAAEHVIHTWYSALIPQATLDALRGRPMRKIDAALIQCFKTHGIDIAREPDQEELKKMCYGELQCSGGTTLQLTLKLAMWLGIRDFFDPPEGMTAATARSIRRAVTKLPSRQDFRERRMFFMRPADRLCNDRFQDDGILLPFGASRESHTIPNP